MIFPIVLLRLSGLRPIESVRRRRCIAAAGGLGLQVCLANHGLKYSSQDQLEKLSEMEHDARQRDIRLERSANGTLRLVEIRKVECYGPHLRIARPREKSEESFENRLLLARQLCGVGVSIATRFYRANVVFGVKE